VRKGLVVAALAAAIPAFVPQTADATPPGRQVAVFLVSGMTFEQFMRVPQFRSLARAGGAALMSFRTVRGDAGPGRVLTLGTGARSAVPFGTVRIRVTPSHVINVVAWRRIVDTNHHRSVPGLLGSVLQAHGLESCADTGRSVLAAVDRSGQAKAEPIATSFGGSGRADCAVNLFSLIGGRPGVIGRLLQQALVANYHRYTRVIVVEANPSKAMLARKDELTPIVIAGGTPATLFHHHGPMHSLTSDTTRRDGVVSNEDVAPTVLSSFGIQAPADMNGAVIRTVDAPPPFDLHRRHLEQRRLTVPIQVGLGIAELIVFLASFFVVWRKPRLRDGVAGRAAAMPLALAVLGIVPLAAGGLPAISYGWVVPFLVVVPVGAGFAAAFLRNRGTLVPAAAIGTSILVFLAVEAAEGWPDTPTTLFGGSALDGARFYGMPNVEIGLLLGSALWVAAVLPPYEGFLLLVAAGLFAGFPDLGVNFGAAITLFFAAGLWLVVRTRRRVAWPELVAVVLVTAAGLAIVVGANLIWANRPTHGTHFVENAPSRGWSGIARLAWDRLLVGWHLLLHAPLAWVPVLGLVPLLYVVLRPTPTVRSAFTRYPAWRDALLVLVVSGMVAYVANDSGAAAAGWGFGMAVAGILYLPLVEETWRTDTARR
jgi:hypothetical protein